MRWLGGWVAARRRSAERVEADADLLVIVYGDQAYAAALDRDSIVHGGRPDGSRPPRHWIRVRRALRQRGHIPAH